MKNTNILARLTLGVALLGAALAPQLASAHGGKHQDVTISIDGRGFHPASVPVKAGKEVHMTLKSEDNR